MPARRAGTRQTTAAMVKRAGGTTANGKVAVGLMPENRLAVMPLSARAALC